MEFIQEIVNEVVERVKHLESNPGQQGSGTAHADFRGYLPRKAM